ncbi:bifunctional non-homologous end joining protein LigD [Bradyrhizobium sp. JR18.2]
MAFQRKKSEALGATAPFPGFIEPALASSVDRVPAGERWIHEIKFDGYRVQLHLANEAATVFTRRGHGWTKRFKKIANDAWHIKASSAIVDGEVVVPAADGGTDFSVLQNELKGTSTKIVLVAFDLLYLNGSDIRKVPLFERKAALKKIITGSEYSSARVLRSTGARCLPMPAKLGSKASSQRCATASTRSAAAIIGSIKPAPNARRSPSPASPSMRVSGMAFILIGARARSWFMPARSITGFDKISAAELRKKLQPLVRKTQPYAKRIAHKGIWVEPKLLAEIEYRAKSAEGKVRHPFFKRLREDL